MEEHKMENEKKTQILGHTLACLTIIVWGSTFIASKIMLDYFTPAQIMIMRFGMAYVVLALLSRKFEKPKSLKDELGIAGLAVMGSTLYFLCENVALTYTLTSNVSIILAAAPIFTAVLAHIMTKDEKLKKSTWGGALIALAGVMLVVFNGTFVLKLNPLGDLLTVLAALCWAVYSVNLKSYVNRYDNLVLTRKIMLYGFLTTLPVVIGQGGEFNLPALARPDVLVSLLFLGLLGSAAGYVTWNVAVKSIGIIKTNNYIYLNPFVTMVAAWLILGEKVSYMGFAGAVLIIGGVFLADR